MEIEKAQVENRKIPPPLRPGPDRFIYRAVVLILGLTLIATLAGGFALTAIGLSIPDGLMVLGSASAGALTGFLAESPSPK